MATMVDPFAQQPVDRSAGRRGARQGQGSSRESTLRPNAGVAGEFALADGAPTPEPEQQRAHEGIDDDDERALQEEFVQPVVEEGGSMDHALLALATQGSLDDGRDLSEPELEDARGAKSAGDDMASQAVGASSSSGAASSTSNPSEASAVKVVDQVLSDVCVCVCCRRAVYS